MLLQQEEGMLESSNQYIQQELTRLKAEKYQKEKEVAVLLEKYNRIQNFDKTVVSTQLLGLFFFRFGHSDLWTEWLHIMGVSI